MHAGNGEWLQRARNFTGTHAVVECGGYGFVSLNDTRPIDIGGAHPSCCFGRGGPVVYVNDTRLHLREARSAMRAEAASHLAMAAREAAEQIGDADPVGSLSEAGEEVDRAGAEAAKARAAAREAAIETVRYLHTGSQWVVLDRTFCHYLIKDERAIRWRKVFAARFLADESFVQTVLMHSPFRSTNINNNLRYIMWPQYYGDPTSYWIRMGWNFVGGPTVINATEAMEVFKTPYLLARKVRWSPAYDRYVLTIFVPS